MDPYGIPGWYDYDVPEQVWRTYPVYAHDEHIVVRAGGDFVTLCPPWQQMAAGTDGYFSSGTPWVFSSSSVDFTYQNIQPRQVIQLTGPKNAFPGTTTLLAIDSVSGNSLTLRRVNQKLNYGQPPGIQAGNATISFVINTLYPQIEEATFDIKRRYGIDENTFYRASAWIYAQRDLRMATILSTLLPRYIHETRSDRGDFSDKIALIKTDLQEVLDRVQVRWGPLGNSAEPSTLFSCRLSR
jgi:hypothetical protein